MKPFETVRRYLPAGLKGPLRSLLWNQLALKWTLRSGIDIQIDSEAAWIIYNEIFIDGEYDLALQQLLAARHKPLCVIDLGANVGFFGLRLFDLARRAGVTDDAFKLILIEGAPSTAATLRSRFSQHENVTVINGLVGARKGVGHIAESHVHFANSVNAEGKGLPVNYVDLGDLLMPEQRIDFLKCDIEGSEREFLENYTDLLLRVDRAVFELHHKACVPSWAFQILASAGLVHHTALRESTSFSVHYFCRANSSALAQ